MEKMTAEKKVAVFLISDGVSSTSSTFELLIRIKEAEKTGNSSSTKS